MTVAPEVIGTIEEIRSLVRSRRMQGARIGFVPTMGALHAGHASLIAHARGECDFLVVSIFVNPLQFDRPDDLQRYPRALAGDVAVCRAGQVDVVFAPSVAEMYPAEPVCSVDVGLLAEHLCGRYRPGHFRGVATVVLKLFEIVRPDAAWFGEKDAQQLAVVRRLVRDFNVPVRICAVPTAREADGLALSSRNARLSPDERAHAPALYRALQRARQAIETGASDPDEIRRPATEAIPSAEGVTLEYFEFVDPETFQPVDRVQGEVIVAGALWVGGTRLIDNVRVSS